MMHLFCLFHSPSLPFLLSIILWCSCQSRSSVLGWILTWVTKDGAKLTLFFGFVFKLVGVAFLWWMWSCVLSSSSMEGKSFIGEGCCSVMLDIVVWSCWSSLDCCDKYSSSDSVASLWLEVRSRELRRKDRLVTLLTFLDRVEIFNIFFLMEKEGRLMFSFRSIIVLMLCIFNWSRLMFDLLQRLTLFYLLWADVVMECWWVMVMDDWDDWHARGMTGVFLIEFASVRNYWWFIVPFELGYFTSKQICQLWMR